MMHTSAALSKTKQQAVSAALIWGASHRCESCNLVSEAFGLDDGHLLCHSLVCVEILCQAWIVLLDDDPGGLFHGLGAHTPLHKGAVMSSCSRGTELARSA